MYRIVAYQMAYHRFFVSDYALILANLPNSLEDNAKYKKNTMAIYYIMPSFPHNLPIYRFPNCNRSYFRPIYRIVTYPMLSSVFLVNYALIRWPLYRIVLKITLNIRKRRGLFIILRPHFNTIYQFTDSQTVKPIFGLISPSFRPQFTEFGLNLGGKYFF